MQYWNFSFFVAFQMDVNFIHKIFELIKYWCAMKQMNIKSIRPYGTLYSRYTSLFMNEIRKSLLYCEHFIYLFIFYRQQNYSSSEEKNIDRCALEHVKKVSEMEWSYRDSAFYSCKHIHVNWGKAPRGTDVFLSCFIMKNVANIM